jgi:uncharacterized membrane protein
MRAREPRSALGPRRGLNAARSAALASLAALLGMSRLHAAPVLLAVFFACYLSGKWRFWMAGAISGLLVFLWVAFIVHHNVDTRVLREGSISGNLCFYLSHPVEFPRILVATLAQPGRLIFYWESFVGILGWLDTRLPDMFYRTAGVCLLVVTAGSVWSRSVGNLWKPRLLLLACSLASVLVFYFALLVDWNERPTAFIEGIQGRYFLIPALIFSYAISAEKQLGEGVARKAALLVCAGFFCLSFFITAQTLLSRFYVMP